MGFDLFKNIPFFAPRLLSVLYIIFIALFALDSRSLVGFLFGLIPSVIVLVALIYSWKDERLGVFAFFVIGLAYTFYFHTYKNLVSFVLLSLPLFFISGMFFVNDKISAGKRKRKHGKRS